jgi:hypothetical protein
MVMAAARGDTKPCTVEQCPGTMQYGRRVSLDAASRQLPKGGDRASTTPTDNDNGWNCTAADSHFRQQ